jgi:hypothetical protein
MSSNRSFIATVAVADGRFPQSRSKLDITFGDNIDGVSGKAGMRVSW